MVRTSILADFGPSASIREAINKVIKEKIDATLLDEDATLGTLENKQGLLDKVSASKVWPAVP